MHLFAAGTCLSCRFDGRFHPWYKRLAPGSLARSMDQSLTITALTRGLKKGIPEIHHSDQGVQYTATDYVNLLKDKGVQISMAEVGQD